jgi:hypothetical protein
MMETRIIIARGQFDSKLDVMGRLWNKQVIQQDFDGSRDKKLSKVGSESSMIRMILQ